tara:strand:+ start:2424 stop:2987 length:564 start_codon:yes stop_codon:yes gene_type:complete
MGKQAGPSGIKQPKSIVIHTSSITSETEEEVPIEPKLSHICIYGDCQKGKRGGSDYCRIHNTPSIKNAHKNSTKKTSKPRIKTNNPATKKATINLVNSNENRGLKAIFGITLIVSAYSVIFGGPQDFVSCLCCFLFTGLGLSLIFQSFRSSKVSAVEGISYFIISVVLLIATFIVLVLYIVASGGIY